jgi:hypothetical protein
MQRAILALMLLALIGCGQATSSVSGVVTVDDAPLENGVISFAPTDGEGVAVVATISSGKYSAQMSTGKKQVQISAPTVVGKRKEYDHPDAPEVEITEELLPERFNSQSELTYDALPGQQTQNWNVVSKDQPKR